MGLSQPNPMLVCYVKLTVKVLLCLLSIMLDVDFLSFGFPYDLVYLEAVLTCSKI